MASCPIEALAGGQRLESDCIASQDSSSASALASFRLTSDVHRLQAPRSQSDAAALEPIGAVHRVQFCIDFFEEALDLLAFLGARMFVQSTEQILLSREKRCNARHRRSQFVMLQHWSTLHLSADGIFPSMAQPKLRHWAGLRSRRGTRTKLTPRAPVPGCCERYGQNRACCQAKGSFRFSRPAKSQLLHATAILRQWNHDACASLAPARTPRWVGETMQGGG